MAYLSDSQQKQVYKWEETWKEWNRQSLSRKQVQKILTWACSLYAVPLPRLRIVKRGKLGLRQGWRTEYDPNDNSLTLAPQHQNKAIVLHEVAHLIHSVTAGDESHEIHGPEWLALYLYLLARAGCAPRIALFASAKSFGLKWKDLDKHNSVRIRATYQKLRGREKLET